MPVTILFVFTLVASIFGNDADTLYSQGTCYNKPIRYDSGVPDYEKCGQATGQNYCVSIDKCVGVQSNECPVCRSPSAIVCEIGNEDRCCNSNKCPSNQPKCVAPTTYNSGVTGTGLGNCKSDQNYCYTTGECVSKSGNTCPVCPTDKLSWCQMAGGGKCCNYLTDELKEQCYSTHTYHSPRLLTVGDNNNAEMPAPESDHSDVNGEAVDPTIISVNTAAGDKGYCIQTGSQRGNALYLGLDRKLDRRCRHRWIFKDVGGSSAPGQQTFVLSTAEIRPKVYLSALPDRLSKLREKPEIFNLQTANKREMKFNFINDYDYKEFDNWGLLCSKDGMIVYKNSNAFNQRSPLCQWQFIR